MYCALSGLCQAAYVVLFCAFLFLIFPTIALLINKIASSIKGIGSGIKKLITVSVSNAINKYGYLKSLTVLRTNCGISCMLVTRINKKGLGLTIA